MNRRSFLEKAAYTLSCSAGVSSLSQLGALAQGQGGTGGYKAMICLFLPGGIDSFNLLLPKPGLDGDPFSKYTAARGEVGLKYDATDGALDKAIQLGDTDFGTHAAMKSVADMFASEPVVPNIDPAAKAAFVANVGSLIQPITLSDIDTIRGNPSELAAMAPRSIASHNDQIKQWQTLKHSGGGSSGWLARVLKTINGEMESPFHHFSLAGTNFAQSGSASQPQISISSGGSPALREGTKPPGTPGVITDAYATERNAAIRAIWESVGQGDEQGAFERNRYEKLFAKRSRDANNNGAQFQGVFNLAGTLLGAFDQAFYEVEGEDGSTTIDVPPAARVIDPILKTIIATAVIPRPLTDPLAIDPLAGITKQTFFLNYGAWDHHNDVLFGLNNNMIGLNHIIERFRRFVEFFKTEDIDATLFTASDFGRTLVPNQDGTDHAWGGNHLVVGKSVNTGIFGDYPTFESESAHGSSFVGPRDFNGRGRLVPTTSLDKYFAAISRWFGVVDGSALSEAFPNLVATTGTDDLASGLHNQLFGQI